MRSAFGGGTGHAIEFAGSAIRSLSMEGRLTICNMSIEAGGRCGMIAPDETTFRYLAERPYAPQGAAFDRAVEDWSTLTTDEDSSFDREMDIDAADIAPFVTWGTSPEDALPIDASVPNPSLESDAARAKYLSEALDYMGIAPGKRLTDIAIDRIFIGSCTNARIEDLRAAAAVLGCSMCVGINGDVVAAGERCASTTNRNFRGRQGPLARTHLMSPAMVAAAAVTGRLADVRPLLAGRRLQAQ